MQCPILHRPILRITNINNLSMERVSYLKLSLLYLYSIHYRMIHPLKSNSSNFFLKKHFFQVAPENPLPWTEPYVNINSWIFNYLVGYQRVLLRTWHTLSLSRWSTIVKVWFQTKKSMKSWKAMRYSVMVFPCKGTSAHIFDRNSFRSTSFRINLGSNLCSKSQLI